MESDKDLVQRVIKGDACAFETLFARYEDAVRRHLTRMVRDGHAADDIAQEVFLRVWTRGEQWSGKGSFRAWLFRIATNLALNRLRSVRRRKEQPLEVPPDTGDDMDENVVPGWMVDASALGPDAVAEQVERHGLLKRLVDDLPEGKREVIRLVYDAGMEIQEASEALGIPEGTAKSRLFHARKRLARQWEELEREDKGD